MRAIKNEVQKWINFGNEIYSLDLKVKILFSLKEEDVVAWAFEEKGEIYIDFNLKNFQLNPQIYFDEIIVHEVAHAFDFVLNPENEEIHGRTWRKIMKDFGFKNPKLFYTITPVPRVYTKFKVHCGCKKPMEITKIIKNRINQGYEYYCSCCEEILVLD